MPRRPPPRQPPFTHGSKGHLFLLPDSSLKYLWRKAEGRQQTEGKLPVESIQIVLEELRKKGNLEWLDKSKSSFLIMWRRPEEWGKLIYQWVSRSGQNNSVFTLYELTNGEDTEDEEFHGLDEATLLRALQALQQEHKAEIITVSDGRGVKFF
nr:vacuolar protein-sorting-associated protein 25 isoform X2 [Pongo pygmaeus]